MSVLVLRRVEKFLRRSRMSPSRVGFEAMRDRRLVFDLRRGRQLRPETEHRLTVWLDSREKGEGPCRGR
ncbi:MAG: hypothetical protein E6G94_01945 [Alphaproteobacteria bacterium]|nr:MAG: hypothetical protein E6G94_01945 [Alphaproteobacteria bacterium]